jgi:hypothetical protein
MRKTLVAVVAAAAVAVPAALAAPALHHARGSGHIQFGASQESISFNARQLAPDMTATGHAVIRAITAGVTVHVDVNCLNVIGNYAIVSGIVTKSSDPTLEGFQAIWAVQDNGEGNDPPDLMSLANFYVVGTGVDCRVPSEFDLVPLESGNVQVD